MIVDETIYFQRRLMSKDELKSESICVNENSDDDVITDDSTSSSTCDWTIPAHILYPVKSENHPIVCQIGTIQPSWTSIATQCILAANYNVNEININLDCPSSRVQGKEFGAVLMQDTSKVILFIHAIQQQLPAHMVVSIKCRIGIIIDDNISSCGNNNDASATLLKTDYDWIVQFIKEVSVVCQRFILHARPVILHGIHKQSNGRSGGIISPAQNRCIPPLNYVWVYRLCHEFPNCNFVINGGIADLATAQKLCHGVIDDKTLSTSSDDKYNGHSVPCTKCQQQHAFGTVKYGSCIVPPMYPAPSNLRGCMIGRAAIDHPIQFAKVDQFWYNDDGSSDKATTRRQVLQQYCQFLDALYPRRCCDNYDTIITSEIPAPKIDPIHPFCGICKDFRQSSFVHGCNDDVAVHPLPNDSSTMHLPSNEDVRSTVKIATRIIDRSLKPILNIFHGCNGSKMFRHDCETLRRNTAIRDCGPAYILHHAAIQQLNISDAILDEPIV